MRSVSLKQVGEATGGSLHGPGRLVVSGVGTDSRDMGGGNLFFALRGERYDGHAFLGEAVEAGAKAAVVENGNPDLADFIRREKSFPLVVVKDSLKALGDLAAWVRKGLDIEVVGITGSTGKTCTKDMLVSALEMRFRVAASPGSYNNEIGTPLTVFSVGKKHQIMITEMGARRTGDIERLAEITGPGMGIITNVGSTHLELFDSPEGVARTKAELARALPENGVLFLNADNSWSRWIARQTKARVVKFGCSRGAHYRASKVRLDAEGHPAFVMHGPGFFKEIELPVVGKHQVENALAAAACANELGIEPDQIAAGLGRVNLSPWRMDVSTAPCGYLVINDSYNANPHSMRAALEALAAVGRNRRTIAVLGAMAELGADSREYHLEVGRFAVDLDVDIIVAVGKRARYYAESALEAGMPRGSVFKCEGSEDVIELLEAVAEPGDVILVKASRVVGLESVAGRLMDARFIGEKAVANV